MAMDLGGGGRGKVKSDINVTPLVDVMLVLLIIMMLVAPMLQKGVDVRLPEAGNTIDKPESQEQTVLAVTAELGLPVLYIGTGERITDLTPFDPAELSAAVTGGADGAAAGPLEPLTSEDYERRQSVWRYLLASGVILLASEADLNVRLLDGMLAHLFETKAELGPSFEAELWDKGWTKAYEPIPLEAFSAEYLERVAARAAKIIGVLEPIRRDMRARRR